MSEELNGQSSQLHQASVEQNLSTEALVCEVSHVKEQLSSVSESTSQTRSKTSEIAQCIQDANTHMSSLSGAMDNINANAEEITKIAKVIEDIAFQTTLPKRVLKLPKMQRRWSHTPVRLFIQVSN